ncbi:hypothetical protein [Shewanella holmiensis]|uniref:Lipoprotein n=1 Tax=Shewanella holmiensis TaxID=2952222 RepID=A0A9X2WQZ7_9GAMM|nr:hypothetical protein [Shewanella holmiensis]MCT7943467.1 hypothetical protein [Shewanella holmiensis]
MLRCVLLVAALSSVLMGCGGSSTDSSTKPKPDENGGTKAKSRYAEGIYLLSLAQDEGDFIRGNDGYSQYVGVGFALDLYPSQQELQASVKQVGKTTADWYNINAKANQLSAFDNNIKVNFCSRDGQGKCTIEQSSIERGDTWLTPLSNAHRAQLQANQFADNIEPLFTDKGFTMRVNDNPQLSALLIQVKARPLTAALMTSLLPSQWETPSAYGSPLDYDMYKFTRDGSAPVHLTVSMTDAQGNPQCIAVGAVSAKQGLIMHFDLKINDSESVPCQQYLQQQGASAELVRAIISNQTIKIGFIEDAKGEDIMAINHLAGAHPVGGAGLLTKQH